MVYNLAHKFSTKYAGIKMVVIQGGALMPRIVTAALVGFALISWIILLAGIGALPKQHLRYVLITISCHTCFQAVQELTS